MSPSEIYWASNLMVNISTGNKKDSLLNPLLGTLGTVIGKLRRICAAVQLAKHLGLF